MGKKWDCSVPTIDIWVECLRVLKPGGHLLAFAGTRTQHRMAVNIEDAGFEIRDMIAWVYGSGFPKSLNISKAIDKKQGNERLTESEINVPIQSSGSINAQSTIENGIERKNISVTKSTSEDGIKWEGWGTALKPALEPITVARKPIEETTITENVLKYGTGGINIDDSRIGEEKRKTITGGMARKSTQEIFSTFKNKDIKQLETTKGRFPANFIHDNSEEVTDLLGDKARFFYGAKCSKKDRNEGLDESKNAHPTVKPTDLMRYLVRLVTPKGGTVLDPFMGSGSTGKACVYEDFNFVGFELDSEYFEIAKARIEFAKK